MDLTSLTSSIDFGPTGAAILAVGGLKVAPIVVQWAAAKVLGFLKRG